MLDTLKVREDFPILGREVNGQPLVYFDNAATTQKPRQVIDALVQYYSQYNANIHRGLHTLSEEASEAYEEAHKKVAGLIGAAWEEMVFTRNTTESLNLLAYSLCRSLKKGDTILISRMEHHSNLVPWQQAAEEKGAGLEYIDLTPGFELDFSSLEEKLSLQPKIVALAHCSNVLGTIIPLKEIAKKAHAAGSLVAVDAAQSVPHMPVDVKGLDVDFLAFSGHKMLAPTGIGALYGKKKLLEELPPFLFGGEMISQVWFEKAEWNRLPWKFEAGTANIADGIAFGTAVDYLQGLGMKNVRAHEKELTSYALEQMESIPGIHLYGPSDVAQRGGVVSFNLGKVHPHDLATILDQHGIAVRSGHHCAQPLMRLLEMEGTARASFYVYNTKEEVDKMVRVLKETAKYFT